MKKKYLISENQFRKLIKIKKDEKIAKRIAEEIFNVKNKLNESQHLIDGSLKDIISKYSKKGYLSEGVITKLNKLNIKIKGKI